jgi:hypothetical protein
MALVIPPAAARTFRVVASKCRATRARDPALQVHARVRAGTLTLFASFGEVGLALTVPDQAGSGSAVIPLDALEQSSGSELPGSAKGEVPTPPAVPEPMAEIVPLFLAELHEAGRTAAREQVRYAVTRVQVRGAAGQVIGTDGKQALVLGGFVLSFTEDVLVPAVPVFGAKELASQTEVRVGRTASHLVVMAGAWTIWLLIDREGRFPDVEGAIPRSRLTTTLEVASTAAFLGVLQELPVLDPEAGSVTLDLGPRVVVRAGRAHGAPPAEALVSGATATGPPLLVALDRKQLLRALALGFHRFRFTSADRPWVASDSTRTYLAAALSPESAIGPGIPGTITTVALPTSPEPPRRTLMPARDVPSPARNGHADPPPAGDLVDPLVEAEGLRTALAEAANRAARLVAVLKQFRRERRALASAWSSLKQLNLGP